VGDAVSMTWFSPILILLAAVLAVFWESAFTGVRHFLGAQIDLLPALMVYTSLSAGLVTVSLLAVLGGLWFDSLSANPLGVTVLPLLICGLLIYGSRELILRDQTFAQMVLGLTASLAVPALVLVALLTSGRQPLVGWGTLWQFIVMGIGGALFTPVFFTFFEFFNRVLGYNEPSQPSFRLDREIKRGR
jgi:cell shape-determining protein MreD